MTDFDGNISFGVAGFPPAFFESKYKKKREDIFLWLNELGLNWIELQNTYGVKMKDEQAFQYRKLAEKYDIGISLHAPYYITLASANEDVVTRSKERILECYRLATKLNSKRIIFHPGHFPGSGEADRLRALNKIISELNSIENLVPAKDIFLYPETAGKISQIGSVRDIIFICSHVSFAKPCMDLAHVHAFERGVLTSAERIDDVLSLIENSLGRDVLMETHFHMYPVEINNNGEKKHKAFDDRIESDQLVLFDSDKQEDRYYPLPEHFITSIKKNNLNPVVICEARDSQDKGALLLQKLYFAG